MRINMNQSIYEKLQAWVVGGFSPWSSVIQLVFKEMTACCQGGYSPRVCEHQAGLFMAAVKIWDPGIQIIRAHEAGRGCLLGQVLQMRWHMENE
jgi:hypothetical protein